MEGNHSARFGTGKEMELSKRLSEICKELQVSYRKPEARDSRLWRLCRKYLCIEGRKVVQAKRKRMNHWPYQSDEVLIEAFEDVEYVLGIIGSDQYPVLFDRAWERASEEVYKNVVHEITAEDLAEQKQMMDEMRAERVPIRKRAIGVNLDKLGRQKGLRSWRNSCDGGTDKLNDRRGC